MSAAVAILGASGGVGSAATRQLHAWGIGKLRLGARDVHAAERLNAAACGGCAAVLGVDLFDSAALHSFCEGADVVVNCAGPSYRVGKRVAVAALAAGAHYVDAGGDEPLHAQLTEAGRPAPEQIALLSAGMLPGLSALLVRALAAEVDRPTRLTAYAGGMGRFTFSAAADYLRSVGDGAGTPLAAWRDGGHAVRVLAPLRDVTLPWFPGRVTAHPFLSTELERVARSLGLLEASWYTVFPGEHVLRMLELGAAADDENAIDGAARALSRAAALDLFGRASYQLFVLELAGNGPRRTLVMQASEPLELTGAAAALATAAVVHGWAPRGLGFAGEVLDPGRATAQLRMCQAVRALEVVESAEAEEHDRVQEGVL